MVSDCKSTLTSGSHARLVSGLRGKRRHTWSCSAFGNCRGSLVVSISKAQILGSARWIKSGLCSRQILPSCNQQSSIANLFAYASAKMEKMSRATRGNCLLRNRGGSCLKTFRDAYLKIFAISEHHHIPPSFSFDCIYTFPTWQLSPGFSCGKASQA